LTGSTNMTGMAGILPVPKPASIEFFPLPTSEVDPLSTALAV
jgi:hypothetical protein